MDFVIAGLAAACAVVFANPLDVLKVRMQLQGELQKKGEHAIIYKNMLHAGYLVAKSEGFLALQKGLVPAIWMQFVMNGLRLGAYEMLDTKGYTRNSDGKIVFYKCLAVAGLCGVLGPITASPLYLVKTQLQSQAAKSIAVGYQHKHTGTWKAFQTIYRQNGMRGLWRGTVAMIPRAFVGSTSQLTVFSYTKEKLVEYDSLTDFVYLKSFLASMISGVAVSVMVSPFDLVLIRIYNQGVDSQGRGLLYKNYIDCVVKIFQSEGITGFYKGLGTIYLRIGPQTLLCLMFWDLFKDIYQRYKSNGGVTDRRYIK